MKKVLWFSRHEMTEDQIQALKDACGEEITVEQIDQQINSAYELKDQIAEHDVIAIVAPIALQQQFLKLAGKRPVIMAVNDRIITEEGKQAFSFVKWERLLKIEVIKEDFTSL